MIENVNYLLPKTNENEIEMNSFTTVDDSYFFKINSYQNSKSSSFLCSHKDFNDNNLFLIDKTDNLQKNIYTSPQENHIDNFKGSVLNFFSVFLFSLNNIIGKVLGYYYPEIENAVTNLIRGLTIGIISFIIIQRENFNLLKKLKSKSTKKLIILFFRCFTGSVANFFLLESLKYLRISSASTIFNLAPIIGTILSVVYLKSKFSHLDIFSFIICFFSLILITKPGFIFNANNEDDPIGILICLIGASFAGSCIFLNKMIAKDFENIIITLILGILFIIESLMIIPFTKNGFSNYTFFAFTCAVLLAIFYFFHVSLFTMAIRISNPVKILPISYAGVVLTLLYNTFIFKQSCDFLDILGSVFIIFVNVFKICYQKNE